MNYGFNRNLKKSLAFRHAGLERGSLAVLAIFLLPLALVAFVTGGFSASASGASFAAAGAAGLVFGEPGLSVRAASNDPVPGAIHLANAQRVVEDHFQQPLTDYVQGRLDRSVDKSLLDKIAPEVPTSRRFEYDAEPTSNLQEFLLLPDDGDVRAPLSDFKRVEPDGRKVTAKTLNKGLTVRRERDSLTVPGSRERVVAWLTKILLRMEIKRAFDLWNSASNTNKTWDASSNPDKDLLDLMESCADSGGLYPNIVLAGSGVWPIRYGALTDATRNFGSPNAGFSMADLAAFLQVDEIVTLKNRYASKKTDSSLSKIAGNVVIAGNLEETPMTEGDASHVKRFVSRDDDSLGAFNEAGFRVFVDETHNKFVDFTVEHYSLVSAPHTNGLEKYTVSAS